MKRRPPMVRDWSEARGKVDAERRCRVCKRLAGQVRLEAAHVLGREYDEATDCDACGGTGEGQRVGTRCGRCKGHGALVLVDPRHVVPLCGPATSSLTCHGKQHLRQLELLPYLTGDEQLAAVECIVRRARRIGGAPNVGIAEAFRRLSLRAEPEPGPEGVLSSAQELPDGHLSIYDVIEER